MSSQASGPKVFTVEQANRMLPNVRQILASLRQQRDALRVLEHAVAVTELEGLQPDGTPDPRARERVAPHSGAYDEGVARMEALLQQLEGFGCQLKDLDQGLVDFFTVHQGQLVYLCWKDGEDRIRFWHFLEDGYAGRRPITELANN